KGKNSMTSPTDDERTADSAPAAPLEEVPADVQTGKAEEASPPPKLSLDTFGKDPARLTAMRALVAGQIRKGREDPAGGAIKMPWLQDRVTAWANAKNSGDTAAAKKSYLHLLRGLESEQIRRGIPPEERTAAPQEFAENDMRDMFGKPPKE